MAFYPNMMLKIIFMILSFTSFILGSKDDRSCILKIFNSQKAPSSQETNLKQTTKTKKKFNLFPCTCYKMKSQNYKSQATDTPALTINTKIKIKHFDGIHKKPGSQQTSSKDIGYPIKMMIRKFSAPTESISHPIKLSRKFSAENVKSTVLLSRKTSGESIKSAIFLSRKSSAQSVNSPIFLSRRSSTESNKSEIPLSRVFAAKRKQLLETKKIEEDEEEASEPEDDDSCSPEDVLLYVCLKGNVENCQKCEALQHIFKNQNFERKYILYNFPLDKLHNPDEHELENLPSWLVLFLYSILASKKDIDFVATTTNYEHEIETNYKSKPTYAKLLIKYAEMQPLGGHLFFSILKSKFLENDLKFFIENDIINISEDMRLIGENEGLRVIGKDKFENTFLFGGIMKEVKKHEHNPMVDNN